MLNPSLLASSCTTSRSKKLLPRALHCRHHHSTMKGYKNWCNAMTSASTMVEAMLKSSVRYVHQMFFLNSPSELTFWITYICRGSWTVPMLMLNKSCWITWDSAYIFIIELVPCCIAGKLQPQEETLCKSGQGLSARGGITSTLLNLIRVLGENGCYTLGWFCCPNKWRISE